MKGRNVKIEFAHMRRIVKADVDKYARVENVCIDIFETETMRQRAILSYKKCCNESLRVVQHLFSIRVAENFEFRTRQPIRCGASDPINSSITASKVHQRHVM
jgi:hypothetical protein